jgi:repressor LexA
MGYASRTSITKIESGRNDLTESQILAFANLFGVTPAYLLFGEGSIFDSDNIRTPSRARIPLLGEIACGEPIFADETRESYVMSGTDLQVDFCLRARGDSMINARILDGDIVFIRKQDIVDNGEIAAVIIGDEATLKRVYYYPEENKLVLAAENPAYPPLVYDGAKLDEIRILGKAVAFQSDVK